MRRAAHGVRYSIDLAGSSLARPVKIEVAVPPGCETAQLAFTAFDQTTCLSLSLREAEDLKAALKSAIGTLIWNREDA